MQESARFIWEFLHVVCSITDSQEELEKSDIYKVAILVGVH